MSQPRRRSGIVRQLVRAEGYVSGPEVLTELRRVIASGQATPGSPIPMDDVAEFFGVSRIPVREALMGLVAEGLVEHQPRLGYTVTALSDDELIEVYVVREALESAAMRAAAPRATAADHVRARAAHDDEAASTEDPAAYQAASRGFHEALARPCRMPRLLHMLDVAWNLTEPAQAMRHVSPEARRELRADHAAMLDAFVAGDGELLCDLGAAHHRRLAESLAVMDRG